MFLIWHGSIVHALNRISRKFPLGLLGKTLAQQLQPFTLRENPWACGLGLLGFPGGSRRLTPGNGLPLLFAVALVNVGGRALIRGGRVLVGKSCPVGASSAHRRIRIFETSHYRLHSDAESWWHKIKKVFTSIWTGCPNLPCCHAPVEQDRHYLFMRSGASAILSSMAPGRLPGASSNDDCI